MKFKLDQNLPAECASLLRKAGFEADTLEDEGLAGAVDTLIAERCRSENRGLVTLDLGFSDIRSYPPGEYCGIVVLRTKLGTKSDYSPCSGV